MRVWGKVPETNRETTSVARAAAEGKSRDDLLKVAVARLAASRQADRFGVWLEPGEQDFHSRDSGTFHGVVVERDGAATPPEWARLSPEPPVPAELLLGLRMAEQQLGHAKGGAMIGALVEMKSAMWVPVKTNGHLRGVVFAGHRSKHPNFPRDLLQSVADELALAVELEDERRLGRERHQDSRRIAEALANSQSPADQLSGIVSACAGQEVRAQEVPPALFAAVGRLVDEPAAPASSPSQSANVDFTWHAGASGWIGGLHSEPWSSIWRRALQTHKVAGAEPEPAAAAAGGRLVAWPLVADGKSLGVLVAVIRRGSASLAALERLERSAFFASLALRQLQREEEEADRKMRQRALLAAVDVAIVILRPDGSIEQFTPRARELAGMPPKEGGQPATSPQPESFFDLFFAPDVPAVRSWLQRVSACEHGGQTAINVLQEAQLRNGTRVRLKAAYFSAYAGTAALLEPLAAREDVGEIRSATAEIINVIEWLEEGVVLFGANHVVRAVNSRLGQILGMTPLELEGIRTAEQLANAFAERSDAGDLAAAPNHARLGSEATTREELHLVRPVPRLLERFARPILDEHGKPLGRLEIYRDLTAQRVFQSRLLQTEKLAELGQMVTNIAHELSNPLTSILGYAQRLLLRRDRAGDSPEARQIFQEAERASGILRQLLLSARESRPERRRVALNQVVSRTLELQRFGLTAGKVHVQLDLEPVLPFVLGDAGQLQQVLVNLIGNSRQAFEEQGRGGTIRVKTMRVGEKRVLLEVSDDGPGIPPAIQARIFDPFFTTKPAGVATGLGLAIVLAIVREHGGTLHLTSSVGEGAIFSIEFPAATVVTGPSAAAGGSRPMRERVQALPAPESFEITHTGVALGPWAGARVMVLEDEPTVARLIADVLEDEGLLVDVLLDPREALERAGRVDYALVVCDMKMPELDGEHFYQALANAKNPLRDRFLFVTGDVLAAHTREFLERNRLPHVAKPFRVEELTGKIRAVLECNAPRQPSLARLARKNAARK